MKIIFGPPWTSEQDAIVAAHWQGAEPISTWAHLLTGRTPAAVEMRGRKLKLGPRPNPHEWTEQQDADLTRLWSTNERITAHMDLFEGHSYDAVMARAHNLGLGKRPDCPRGQAPIAWPLIERQLKKESAHRYRLADVLRLHPATVSKQLNLHHDAKEIHVVEWFRRTRTSAPIPVFAYGPGIDVPKPAPLTNAEKQRRIAAHAKQKRILAAEPVRGVNPFATACGTVAAPQGETGRVVRNLVDDREAA